MRIPGLTRNGKAGAGMDNLTYSYGTGNTRSNRLLRVTDGDKTAGFIDGANTDDDYVYDLNGNMIVDKNKGVTSPIVYNHLNLPQEIVRGTSAGKLNYIYDAMGRKLQQVVNYAGNSKLTDYSGEYEYLNDILQSAQHEEGRVVFNQRKDIVYNDGSSTSGPECTGCSTSSYTPAGSTEKYILATASRICGRFGDP